MSSIHADRPMLTRTATDGHASGDMANPTDAERVEHLAYRFGQAYDSYLVVESDRRYFWSRDRTGVVGYAERGKYVHVVGGLLAAPEARADLLAQFLRFLDERRGKSVIFYNLVTDDLPLFGNGFEITKCGEEPIVDLASATWRGGQYEWLRRQERYCLRQGLECIEVSPRDGYGGLADDLRALAREHAENTTHGREMTYFVSRFDLDRLGRRRLFVARGNGRLEGFVVCNPCLGGRMWAIETYRRRADAVRGVTPFIMMHAMRKMKSEGVERVSLSLVPGLRAEQGYEGDSVLFRWGQVLWLRSLNWIYDMRGIYHYKSRFRPDFRPMYIAARPRLTVLAIKSLFDTWGMFEMTPRKLFANVGAKLRKWGARKTMASPTSTGTPEDAGDDVAGTPPS